MEQDETYIVAPCLHRIRGALPKLRGVMIEDNREALDKMQNLLQELGDDALNEAFRKAKLGQYGQFQWKGMVYPQEQV